jgi:uncharacterized membrane protein
MIRRPSVGPARVVTGHRSDRLPVAWLAVLLLAALLGATTGTPTARAADPVVHAVLFYSPTCPHCHQVIEADLPPIQDRFGDGLHVLFVDVSDARGAALYQQAVARFNVPEDRLGVPTLVVGDLVLVGSGEIPTQLPALVERMLADGGSNWPDIPGLAAVLPSPSPSSTNEAAQSPTAGSAAGDGGAANTSPSDATSEPRMLAVVLERFGRDRVGNAVAVVVLLGLLGSLVWVVVAVVRRWPPRTTRPPSGWIAGLALTGMAIAGYLASVELAGGVAVCGPVGNCTAVHASVYARLLGVPVGVLGLLGYAAIFGCWLVARLARGRVTHIARTGIPLIALAGTLFSIYLTFLEPFVIGATCAWCLASAVLMATILVTATVAAVPSPSAVVAQLGGRGAPPLDT